MSTSNRSRQVTDGDSRRQRRRRVLFVTPWYPNDRDPIAGTFVEEHARAVARRHDVQVLVVEDRPTRGLWTFSTDTDAAARSGLETYRVSCRPLRFNKIRAIIRALALVDGVRRVRRSGFRMEILHANIFEAGFGGAIASLLWRSPMVLTEHYSIFARRALTRSRWVQAWIAVKRARVVMPVSRSLDAAMRAYGLTSTTRIVPNAVDEQLFRPHSSSPDSPPLVLFVGRLHADKDPLTFIDALERLATTRQDWQAVLVGDGELRQQCADRARAASLAGLLTMAGSLPKAEVAELMGRATCLVLTSRTENLPCVVLEAFVVGVPVIATVVGGLPEMVDSTNGVLVPPGDSRLVAEAIDRVLSDRDRYDRVRISGDARSRYSYDAVASAISEVYEEAIGA